MQNQSNKKRKPFIDNRNVERGAEWLRKMIEGIGKKKPEEIIAEMNKKARQAGDALR